MLSMWNKTNEFQFYIGTDNRMLIINDWLIDLPNQIQAICMRWIVFFIRLTTKITDIVPNGTTDSLHQVHFYSTPQNMNDGLFIQTKQNIHSLLSEMLSFEEKHC